MALELLEEMMQELLELLEPREPRSFGENMGGFEWENPLEHVGTLEFWEK